MNQELRDIQKKKREEWEAKKQADAKKQEDEPAPPDSTAIASSPTPTSGGYTSAASSSQAPPLAPSPSPARVQQSSIPSSSEPPSVRRIHILPVGAEADGSNQPRLQLLKGELTRIRTEKVIVRSGQFLKSSGFEFIVVKAEPDEGIVVADTDFFLDGDYAVHFEKVQFICLWDFQSSGQGEDPTSLFSEYISPYFRSISDSDGGGQMGNVVTVGNQMNIFDREFKVIAAEPGDREIGIIDKNTMVFVDWDSTPEFDKIHIVPFQDTLPGAYEFDVFTDYLKPYLTRNKHQLLSVNEQFMYQGVQFKVVCCEPQGPARVGKNTTIYCEGMLHPSLRNLLPPELLEQLSHLPPGLQMLLMNTEALAGGYQERVMEVQEMLSHRRGLSNETISQIETLRWDESSQGNDQKTCMVCLSDFTVGEEVRRLPCGHVFHASCIDEWLRRCTDCPICKANVDRAVRQY